MNIALVYDILVNNFYLCLNNPNIDKLPNTGLVYQYLKDLK